MKEFWKKVTTGDMRNIIAFMYVSLVLIYIYVLVFAPVPANNKDLINVIGGNVIAGLSLVLGYFFGSSKNNESNDKTKQS